MALRPLLLSLSLACGSSASTGSEAEQPVAPSPPRMGQPREARGPVVEVLVDDPAADEGDFYSFTIHPSGSYDGQHVWSDGGAEDNRVRCSGRLPEAEARIWFDYARSSATLDQPRAGSPDPASGRVVTVSHEDDAGVVLHAPIERQDELLGWARALVQSCPR